MTDSMRAYRASAGDSTTHIGLLLSVYDALAEDLRMAGAAAAAADVQGRCRYSQHALQLLGHLESWLPLLGDAPLQDSLACLYGYLRSETLRLQSVEHTSGFAKLAMHVCETRAVWQKKQSDARRSVQQLAPAVISEGGRKAGPRCTWSA